MHKSKCQCPWFSRARAGATGGGGRGKPPIHQLPAGPFKKLQEHAFLHNLGPSRKNIEPTPRSFQIFCIGYLGPFRMGPLSGQAAPAVRNLWRRPCGSLLDFTPWSKHIPKNRPAGELLPKMRAAQDFLVVKSFGMFALGSNQARPSKSGTFGLNFICKWASREMSARNREICVEIWGNQQNTSGSAVMARPYNSDLDFIFSREFQHLSIYEVDCFVF